MQKLLSFFKNNKVLVVVLFGIIVLVAYVLARGGRETRISPTPIPTVAPSWNSLVPEASLFEDVIRTLGQPIQQNGNILMYPSESKNRNHEIILKNQKVVFIKEIVTVEGLKITDMDKRYGFNKIQLYSNDTAYYLFVYPDKGIAYIGNPIANNILEIWYFRPTTLDEFLLKWATAYSTRSPAPGPYGE